MKQKVLTPEYMQKLRELVAAKLLNVRFLGETQIAILKYSKRAFWTGAWNQYPELKETRGMIIDWETGRIIALPFTKVFNWGETEESKTMFRDDEYVIEVIKVNGFLAIATYDEPTDRYIFTSSGTFDSEFADMAKQYLDNERVRFMLRDFPHLTFMFEIAHPNDPHIVDEDEGAHLIGAREKFLGSTLQDEETLDHLFEIYLNEVDPQTILLHRPMWTNTRKFGELTASRGWWSIEGYMVRGIGDDRCLKIKGTEYLTLKFLSRSNKVDAIWDDPNNFLKTIDEDFHEIVKELPCAVSKEVWKGMDDKTRLKILREVM